MSKKQTAGHTPGSGGANGIASHVLLKTLSDDAKIIAGCLFGMLGIPGRSTLTYHMQESRPTARTQQALDELVSAGVLTVTPFNQFGGVTYTVQINTSEFYVWAQRNQKLVKAFGPVTEPIAKAKGARP